jgi:uncharacterized protein YecE (DUF72 family)
VDSLFAELYPSNRGEFDREVLADRLAALARQNIFIGGSSWKYEGWVDQIYDRSRYLTRGRFSKKVFEESCLSEYATIFPTVCGDFAFYQFPTEEFWRRLFLQVPPGFQFGFKVPEQITCKVFPAHARYGSLAGLDNPSFLDARLFLDAFLRPLIPYHAQTGVLIFEFGTFAKKAYAGLAQFLEALDRFLKDLPGEFRYAVEIRNASFLAPEYLDCLRSHNVAHVYNAWTRMPELPEQLAVPGSETADFLVTRALLRQGRPYEDAVKMFQPYAEVRDVNERAREGMREIIQIAKREKKTAFLFVNNRLEGNSPATMISITDEPA